jgi:hypothetical protein
MTRTIDWQIETGGAGGRYGIVTPVSVTGLCSV